jgi:UTP:GlnB (protein PII) uridylyltransferase
VFAQAEGFAARVAREIAERRRAEDPLPPGTVHLKEGPGGLREIDLVLAVAKARHGLWEAPGVDPFEALAALDAPQAGTYRALAGVNEFLVALRSVYRVAVAATDEVERAALAAPARLLGHADEDACGRLFTDLERRLRESRSLVDRLLAATG